MRVLHVLGSPNIGGIEKLALDFIQSCNLRTNILNGVLFTHGEDGDMLNFFFQLGCETSLGKLSSGYDFNLGKLRVIKKLFSNYDILHIHTFSPFIALLATKSGKKIVYTEHGNFGFGREWKPSDSIKKLLLKKFLHHKVNHCIYNSQFTKQIADKRYGTLANNKSTVVYNGIKLVDPKNVSNLKGYAFVEFEGKYIVGTVSRFAGFKRIDRLIRSFFVFQLNKKDVLLLLVGDGSLTSNLQQLVKEFGMESKVIFTGYQCNPLSWMKTMDVCMFPSNKEPFGLVAIEAMSMDKPVIVFGDGGGFIETVGNFSTDDLAENEEYAAKRLEYYYEQYKNNEALTISPLMKAKQYSIEKMVDKIIKIYKAV